ncbi:protein LplC [Paenibacillus marchantiophytorum]|uniref:Protein LplC n=1 Tax=Paenibacillus marchantiophytorum TaxID=1619310 RepID=A0ABQ2BSF7_9BACL|nr:carbohydrate ABC transporter permease [Paenibacillus marchantiophytorum]GGI46569.1 protein LplC [Paenibacillus marchantiophytorum]
MKVSHHSVSYEHKTFSRKVFVLCNYTWLSLLTFISFIPIWNILSMSFSDNKYVSAGEIFLWPKGITFSAYTYILNNQAFYHALLISIERTVLGVLITMICTILVAYPLSKSKRDFRARGYAVWFFLITMLFNGGLIPWFMMVKYTGLYNTMGALVIVPAVQVFNILLLMNFIKDLPREIEESAFLDGAGHFQLLGKIILPLSMPAIATLILFTFVFHWNNWFDGLLFMTSKENYPMQTYLYTVLTVPDTTHMTTEEIKMFYNLNQRSIKAAEIFIATLPILILYPYLQKYFTKGLVLGSVKG